MSALDAGAGHKNAHLVAVGENLGCQGRDLLLVGHVGCVDPGSAAELLDGFLGFGRAGITLHGG